jgi:SAM-dependent methyltransferase
MSALSEEQVKGIYNIGYELGGAAPKSDAARARAYGQWIRSERSPPRTILEVGCGSGALLRELSAFWPQASCFGIDPALPEASRSDGRVRLERGFIDDVPPDAGNFDLIVAVNVIEHTSSPRDFLASLRSRLTLDGSIVITCPVAEPPNNELMFFDHLFSLTAEALGLAVVGTPLTARRHSKAPPEIGDFQMVVFDTQDPASPLGFHQHGFSDLWSGRQSYIESWRMLDQLLFDRSQSFPRLLAFGGGQTAALLRAYAPRTWARIELIVLDEENEGWTLDRPVASYKSAKPGLEQAGVLIATTPQNQGPIADRLRGDGLHPIRWDDLIAR